jgi:fibro-slime domain-containing protein
MKHLLQTLFPLFFIIWALGCEENINQHTSGGTDSNLSTDNDTASDANDTETAGVDTNLIDTENMPKGCGDGILTDDEACDDGNHLNGDGCHGDCLTVEEGWSCNPPGLPCHQMAICGDGAVLEPELCDDSNTENGDGCSRYCQVEVGYKCKGSPSVCSPTKCGDGKQEGAESCDDGNDVPFDGCSAICQKEPDCAAGACASECGDGLVLGEQCDDGNKIDGDGCSSSCKIEDGYTCVQKGCEDEATCTLQIAAVVRDFTGSHSDFGVSCDGLVYNAVAPTLGSDGKPVTGPAASSNCTSHFEDWYTAAPSLVANLTLYPDGNGNYVNQYGPNGEKWVFASDPVKSRCGESLQVVECSRNSNDCASCPVDSQYSDWTCEFPCPDYDSNRTCLVSPRTPCEECPAFGTDGFTCNAPCGDSGTGYTPYDTCQTASDNTYYDGNPLFFPIDALGTDMFEAKIPEEYGYDGWPWEKDIPGGSAVLHNFYFTTEVTYWFAYDETTPATLNFTGDDDVWVFINGQLAVDLGGVHVPENGSVIINSTNNYGMENGKVYKINIFHAERKRDGSSFKLTLGGFNTARSECTPECGDGVVSLGEQCDDGVNDGGYGECGEGCVLDTYCGDGIIQKEFEDCDDGNFLSGDNCPSSCRVIGID